MAGKGTHVPSGARLVFFYNNKPVAYATSVNGGEDIQFEPVDTLDSLPTREYVPVHYTARLGASIFRTVADGPSTVTSPGSLKEIGIMPYLKDVLTTEGVPAYLQDRNTQKILCFWKDVKCEGNNWNVGARQITVQNVTFNTTQMFDESEMSGAQRGV